MKIRTRLPLRTKLVGEFVRRGSAGVESVKDFESFRSDRLKLQNSALGKWAFGTVDSRVELEERMEPLGGILTRVVIFRPKGLHEARPGLLYFHGGGWVLGQPEQSRWLCSKIAADLNMVVIAPSYRLAPEHRYPAAFDDAWAALTWIDRHRREIGVTSVSVGGDSAGGNLAAAVAMKARDENSHEIVSQVLIYPAVEMYDVFPSEHENADAYILTSANMRAYVRLYLGESYGTKDVYASPLRAENHANLPPAIVITAGHDPLLDNGTKYVDALFDAGVDVLWHHEPGTVHGFMSLPGACPQAKSTLRVIEAFLEHRVG